MNPLTDPWPRIETCQSCGITHRHVEMLGIYYCPNPLCKGCGAWSHRRDLSSFKTIDGGQHTVDPQEVLDVLYSKALETGDQSIIDAANRMKPWWESRNG